MGILPLQFSPGESAESHILTGEEIYSFLGLKAMLDNKFADGKTLHVKAVSTDGSTKLIATKVRIDTPQEIAYFENGGILQYVLRSLATS
jgi:aconitate hydratase